MKEGLLPSGNNFEKRGTSGTSQIIEEKQIKKDSAQELASLRALKKIKEKKGKFLPEAMSARLEELEAGDLVMGPEDREIEISGDVFVNSKRAVEGEEIEPVNADGLTDKAKRGLEDVEEAMRILSRKKGNGQRQEVEVSDGANKNSKDVSGRGAKVKVTDKKEAAFSPADLVRESVKKNLDALLTGGDFDRKKFNQAKRILDSFSPEKREELLSVARERAADILSSVSDEDLRKEVEEILGVNGEAAVIEKNSDFVREEKSAPLKEEPAGPEQKKEAVELPTEKIVLPKDEMLSMVMSGYFEEKAEEYKRRISVLPEPDPRKNKDALPDFYRMVLAQAVAQSGYVDKESVKEVIRKQLGEVDEEKYGHAYDIIKNYAERGGLGNFNSSGFGERKVNREWWEPDNYVYSADKEAWIEKTNSFKRSISLEPGSEKLTEEEWRKKGEASFREMRLGNILAEIKEKRHNPENAQRIDAIIREQGKCEPGTPEAAVFVEKWDKEQAEKIFEEEEKRRSVALKARGRKEELHQSIITADSFDALTESIEKLGTVKDGSKIYNASELEKMLGEVREGKREAGELPEEIAKAFQRLMENKPETVSVQERRSFSVPLINKEEEAQKVPVNINTSQGQEKMNAAEPKIEVPFYGRRRTDEEVAVSKEMREEIERKKAYRQMLRELEEKRNRGEVLSAIEVAELKARDMEFADSKKLEEELRMVDSNEVENKKETVIPDQPEVVIDDEERKADAIVMQEKQPKEKKEEQSELPEENLEILLANKKQKRDAFIEIDRAFREGLKSRIKNGKKSVEAKNVDEMMQGGVGTSSTGQNIDAILNESAKDKEGKVITEADVEKAKKEYREAVAAYGEINYKKREDLVRSAMISKLTHEEGIIGGPEFEKRLEELMREDMLKFKKEIFKEIILDETDLLAKEKVSAMEPRKRNVFRKMLENYAKMPTWQKVAVSTAVVTGAMAAGGAIGGGAAALMFGGSRFVRGMIGGKIAAFSGALTKTFFGKKAEEFRTAELDKLEQDFDVEIGEAAKKKGAFEDFLLKNTEKYELIVKQVNKKHRNASLWAAGAAVATGGLSAGVMSAASFDGPLSELIGGKLVGTGKVVAPETVTGKGTAPISPEVKGPVSSEGVKDYATVPEGLVEEMNSSVKAQASIVESAGLPEEEMAELMTVKKGEGAWHPVHRQLEEFMHRDPEGFSKEFGIDEGDFDNPEGVKKVLNKTTFDLLVKNGFIDPENGVETRISKPGMQLAVDGNEVHIVSGEGLPEKMYEVKTRIVSPGAENLDKIPEQTVVVEGIRQTAPETTSAQDIGGENFSGEASSIKEQRISAGAEQAVSPAAVENIGGEEFKGNANQIPEQRVKVEKNMPRNWAEAGTTATYENIPAADNVTIKPGVQAEAAQVRFPVKMEEWLVKNAGLDIGKAKWITPQYLQSVKMKDVLAYDYPRNPQQFLDPKIGSPYNITPEWIKLREQTNMKLRLEGMVRSIPPAQRMQYGDYSVYKFLETILEKGR